MPENRNAADDAQAMLVLTTIGDDASAREMSRTLVEERLAACVTRSAVRSVYRWETPASGGGSAKEGGAGSVCEEEEILLLIKTSTARVEQLERRVRELHSYDCPELIRVAPGQVEPAYLAWLLQACGETG